jgi:3-carboxy-cis,cis-muconate cycloisomerase
MTNSPSFTLLTPVISSVAMRALAGDRARLQRMLDFEMALARAEAALAVIPAGCVEPIAAAAQVDRYDVAAISAAAAAAAGDVAVPLIEMLTAEVAKGDAEAARYVNWGAASQDVIDTALMLELREGIDALLIDIERAIDGFVSIAGRHRRTAAVARTSLQHTLPMPFGLKVAGYAATLGRSRDRLRRLRKDGLALQFGGPAGTLASLGERGLEVTERLAALLDLPAPAAPWHGHGDRIAEIASALTILAGSCGKIARDVSLMMQIEVAEVPTLEGDGTATGKSRPRPAALALGAATMAPNLLATVMAGLVQEHEGGLGGAQAQWHAVPALLLVASGALAAIAEIAQGLDIDPERTRSNLDISQGRIMAEAVSTALGSKVGWQTAHAIVEEASRKAIAEKRALSAVLADDERVTSQLNPAELAQLFELMRYQGVSQTYIDRLIGALGIRGHRR